MLPVPGLLQNCKYKKAFYLIETGKDEKLKAAAFKMRRP